jgi:hypothetical protein
VAEFFENLAELLANLANNSVSLTEFRISKIFLFLSHVNYISAKFFWFSTIFSEFFKMRWNRWEVIFYCPLNFVTLGGARGGETVGAGDFGPAGTRD